jgi:hypothetical protein
MSGNRGVYEANRSCSRLGLSACGVAWSNSVRFGRIGGYELLWPWWGHPNTCRRFGRVQHLRTKRQ